LKIRVLLAIHRLTKSVNHVFMVLHSGKQPDHCVAKTVSICRRKELVFTFCTFSILPLSAHGFSEKDAIPGLENTSLAP